MVFYSLIRTFAQNYEKELLFGGDNDGRDADCIVLDDEVCAGRRIPAEQGEDKDGRRISRREHGDDAQLRETDA